jgi:hypothetical protein
MSRHPIIALWSHPRSMSTAFERVMRARGDIECLHEPFMYDYYINRAKRVMPHFDAKPDHPRSYEAIRDWIVGKAERGPVFFKDMSYYVVPHIFADTAFMQRVTHSFLLREPAASILSYVKLDPDVTCEEIGIEAQWQHASWLMQSGSKPIVVLSEKLQADAAAQMQRYWQAVGLPDKPSALEWGEQAPDDWKQVSGWHKDVMASKSIRPPDQDAKAKTLAELAELQSAKPQVRGYLEHHAPFHRHLSEFGL